MARSLKKGFFIDQHLLDKVEARQAEVTIDYRGFEIDDVFVVGYGLDYDERYRNLPYIGVCENTEEE